MLSEYKQVLCSAASRFPLAHQIFTSASQVLSPGDVGNMPMVWGCWGHTHGVGMLGTHSWYGDAGNTLMFVSSNDC